MGRFWKKFHRSLLKMDIQLNKSSKDTSHNEKFPLVSYCSDFSVIALIPECELKFINELKIPNQISLY